MTVTSAAAGGRERVERFVQLVLPGPVDGLDWSADGYSPDGGRLAVHCMTREYVARSAA
jgi:hypothetical protein